MDINEWNRIRESNEEKILLIEKEKAKLNCSYTDEILLIIAKELIKLNEFLKEKEGR